MPQIDFSETKHAYQRGPPASLQAPSGPAAKGRGPIATVPPLPVNSRYIAGLFSSCQFQQQQQAAVSFSESIIFPSSTLYTPRTGSWGGSHHPWGTLCSGDMPRAGLCSQTSSDCHLGRFQPPHSADNAARPVPGLSAPSLAFSQRRTMRQGSGGQSGGQLLLFQMRPNVSQIPL